MVKQMTNSRRIITADEAKKMLMEKDRSLLAIDKKINLLYNELMQFEDELLRVAALPGKPDGIAWSGSGEHKDNFDVLERYKRQKRERSEEIRLQMWKLSEKADNIRHLWNCFMALEEPYYSILFELYVKKELYAAAQCSSGFSHRGFEQNRKKGLDLLAEMYNSGYSAMELMEMTGQKEKPKAKKKKDPGCPGQMVLPFARMSGETSNVRKR